MRGVRVTALFWQAEAGHYVNHVTPMKAVTCKSVTFVMQVII